MLQLHEIAYAFCHFKSGRAKPNGLTDREQAMVVGISAVLIALVARPSAKHILLNSTRENCSQSHRIHRILYILRQRNMPSDKGGIRIPKNVTIYLSDAIAGKMEKYPEVNWSEICRKAVVDYVDTRSHMDIGPILEKLKAERNEAYKQGQILFYQIAPKMSLREFEIWYPRVNAKIIQDRQASREDNSDPLSPEFAEHEVVIEMRYMMGCFCRDNNIPYPSDTSDAFWEGAITAFMDVYSKIKPKKN